MRAWTFRGRKADDADAASQALCSMHATQLSVGFGTLRGSRSDDVRGRGSQLPSCAIVSEEAANLVSVSCFWRDMGCIPIEHKIVGTGMDVKRWRFTDPMLLRSDVDLEVERHVAFGHAQHRTWCDTSTTARGLAGRHR